MLKTKNKKRYLVWLTFAIRLLVAFYILINPLWGLVASFVADYFDSQMLLHLAGFDREEYQYWDKNVDWLSYITMFMVGVWFGYTIPLLTLLLFRLVGQIYFIRTGNEDYLKYFPDLFTFTFIWLVLGSYTGFTKGFTDIQFWGGLAILWLLKVLHEYILHDLWPNYLKENGYPEFLKRFGYDKVKV